MCPFVRGGYYEVRTYFIDTLPIPKVTNAQKEQIATLAEVCQSTAELRYQLESGIRSEIPALCPGGNDPKLNNKLKSWWTMSFDDFKKEIKKQYKHSMSLEESMNWKGVFEGHKQEIQIHCEELDSKEQQLNEAVYALFGLDKDEINLLKESLRLSLLRGEWDSSKMPTLTSSNNLTTQLISRRGLAVERV